MSAPTKKAIIWSYRQLYRHGLRAVQYSTPERQTLRKRLQHKYRTGQAVDYNEQAIANTIEFLRGAANATGLEHRIVKRLIFVWWWETMNPKSFQQYANDAVQRLHPTHKNRMKKPTPIERYLRRTALEPFYFTLQMLDDTMGMCLR